MDMRWQASETCAGFRNNPGSILNCRNDPGIKFLLLLSCIEIFRLLKDIRIYQSVFAADWMGF
jgi:hypothetical protein